MTSFTELPSPQRRAIELVREAAVEKDCRPFLVGGPVRDLMLGRQAIDIDLTVENDSAELARALAKHINGRVKSFPQFLTYKVVADGMPEIDIATARKEKYRTPGALPTVSPGRLKDDLLRRDFSINAIAMDLRDGTVHDPANGAADLREGLVRILHDQSFLDDPTRIFRAIRIATRLGFTIEEKTARQMKYAIEAGALETISKERIWRELTLAMDEANAPAVLGALLDAGALRPLFGTLEKVSHEFLEKVRAEVASNPDVDRYVLYTGALLRRADATPSELEGSGFSQKRARAAMLIANESERLLRNTMDAKSDRHRFRVLKRLPEEVLAALLLDAPDFADTVKRYRDFRGFALPIRGNDLEVPAGPHIARALERTREAVFTGEVSADDARSFARELALKYYNQHHPEEVQP